MRARVALIAADAERDPEVQRLVRALEELGPSRLVDPASLRVLVGGGGLRVFAGEEELEGLEAAVVGRLASGPADPEPIFDAVRALERMGVRCVNRVGPMLEAQDKLLSAVILQAAGLPTPRCVSVPTAQAVESALKLIDDPVAKPLFGSLGEGMYRVKSPAERRRLLAEAARSPFLLQAFVAPGGVDYRLFVVGEKVEACIRREAPLGEWRSNVGRGARASEAIAPAHWRTLALEASRALGLEVAGIDLALDEGRPTILEVNGFPRFSGVLQATGRDMAPLIARHALRPALGRRRSPLPAGRRQGG